MIGFSSMLMLYPLRTLTSAKYLVPGISIALIGLAYLLRQPTTDRGTAAGVHQNDLHRINVWCSVAVLAACYVFGVQRDRESGFVSISQKPSSVFWTHDGFRTLGAYLRFPGMIGNPERRPPIVRLNHNVAAWILRAPTDATVIFYDRAGPDLDGSIITSWSWGWPALYLQNQHWKVESYLLKQSISLLSADGRRATILVKGDQDANQHTNPGCTLKIGPLGSNRHESLKRFAQMVSDVPCRP
jgi:hypothetical protein